MLVPTVINLIQKEALGAVENVTQASSYLDKAKRCFEQWQQPYCNLWSAIWRESSGWMVAVDYCITSKEGGATCFTAAGVPHLVHSSLYDVPVCSYKQIKSH